MASAVVNVGVSVGVGVGAGKSSRRKNVEGGSDWEALEASGDDIRA